MLHFFYYQVWHKLFCNKKFCFVLLSSHKPRNKAKLDVDSCYGSIVLIKLGVTVIFSQKEIRE